MSARVVSLSIKTQTAHNRCKLLAAFRLLHRRIDHRATDRAATASDCLARIQRLNAISLFGLWLVQFVYPNQLPLPGDTAWNNTRILTAYAFGALIAIELIKHRRDIHMIENLRAVAASMQSRRATLIDNA